MLSHSRNRAPAATASSASSTVVTSTWTSTSGKRAPHRLVRRAHRAGGELVVVLDHRDVVQAHPLVGPAAAAHRVLLQRAQPRRGLAGVQHHRPGPGEHVGPAPGVGRHAGHAATAGSAPSARRPAAPGWPRAASTSTSPRRTRSPSADAQRDLDGSRTRAAPRRRRARAPNDAAARRPPRRPGPRGARSTLARAGIVAHVVTSAPPGRRGPRRGRAGRRPAPPRGPVRPRCNVRRLVTRPASSGLGDRLVLGLQRAAVGRAGSSSRWPRQCASSRSGKSERRCPPRVSSRRRATRGEQRPTWSRLVVSQAGAVGLGRRRRQAGERGQRLERCACSRLRADAAAPAPRVIARCTSRRCGGVEQRARARRPRRRRQAAARRRRGRSVMSSAMRWREDQPLQQRVRRQPVGAVHAGAGDLAAGVQARRARSGRAGRSRPRRLA